MTGGSFSRFQAVGASPFFLEYNVHLPVAHLPPEQLTTVPVKLGICLGLPQDGPGEEEVVFFFCHVGCFFSFNNRHY
jgi:hypothetical protein